MTKKREILTSAAAASVGCNCGVGTTAECHLEHEDKESEFKHLVAAESGEVINPDKDRDPARAETIDESLAPSATTARDTHLQIPMCDSHLLGTRLAQMQIEPPRVRYGTIRYSGSVMGKLGFWLGIEWDDVSNGKHDGSYKGRRYFTCSRQGNVASFIRPPTSASADVFVGGLTFLDALEARYAACADQRPSSIGDEMLKYHSRKTLADIEIEIPNFEKVIRKNQNFTKLTNVSLTGPPETTSVPSHLRNPSYVDNIRESLKILV